jgi:hypothetical protein
MNRKLKKDELIELVTKIRVVEGSEEEIDNWIDIIENETGCPEISDYIFWSEEELNPEQIVNKALAYKPTVL